MPGSRLTFAQKSGALALPEDGAIALTGALLRYPLDGLATDRVRPVTRFRPAFERLEKAGFRVGCRFDGTPSAAIVAISRSRAHTLGLISEAFKMTEPGGLVVVDGAKTDGIESILKAARAHLGVTGVSAKFHGKLFWARRPNTLPDALADWSAAAQAKRNEAGYFTAPGMFSHAGIDAGSALLADAFDQRLSGEVADLGAGWGWLADQALRRGDVARIDLFEADGAALAAARRNVVDPRAAFHWADVATLAQTPRYDAIISNPPFHVGHAAQPEIGLAFIRKAAALLRPKGRLWLVANRQLPYEATLDACFTQWSVVSQTSHFKVIRAERPNAGLARTRVRNPVRSRR
ncbi:MAG: class I SAM-dependent methyltransferase [Paracoccaceae bacterium]